MLAAVIGRSATGALLAGLIALAVPASAHAAAYAGKIKGAPGSSFEFKKSRDGGERVVRSVEANNIPMTCDSGSILYGFGGNATGNIHPDRSFKVLQTFGPETEIRIRGGFNGAFQKATGTLRAKTTTMMTGDCRSGKVDWKASLLD